MRYFQFLILLGLVGCSSIKYEIEYFKARSEVKRSSDYVPWERAKSEIEKRCAEIKSIYQGHSRVISISFIDKTQVESITDYLDEIIDVTHECMEEGTVIIME